MASVPGRPVVFGEVLFDRFEDGTRVLGGAPFNVAWHLAGFGLDPLFISRVGRDELGEQVLTAMTGWGLDVGGLQRDASHPTGSVHVSLSKGQPDFRILPDQAYDYIDADAVRTSLAGLTPALLYHGSLVARNRVSRKALEQLRATGVPAFVDINLRAPWWQRKGLDTLVHGARWLKLSETELAVLMDTGALDPGQLESTTRMVRERYGCALLVVTQGEHGGWFATRDAAGRIEPVAVPEFADAVGAGDAFSSVTLLGLVHGWPLPKTLRRAAAFAARICTIRGATTSHRALYDEMLTQWESD